MANKFTRFLKQVGTGLLNPKGVMGNYQHATRLFVDNTYRLSPRTKFLYYVRFEIDKSAHQANLFNERHIDEIGYLIKKCDLPKFQIETLIKNQYNRKKLLYKMINYEPLNLTFHDDSAGVINALLAIYYGTYFRDRHNPTYAYNDTHYAGANIDFIHNLQYGLDNSKSVDLFKSISIYTMSRRRFLGYTLVNPRIISWQHGSMDYTANDFNESMMNVQYESVIYSGGNVSFNNPKGFATLYYDTVPSPLSVQGGGVANLFGDGGVLDGLESIFGDVSSGTAFGSVGGFIGTAIKTVNVYQNSKRLSKASVLGEVVGAITSPAAVRGAVNGVSGLINTAFPKPAAEGADTVASPKRIIPYDPN